MNIERLKKLADFLEFDPRVKGHFNLMTYVNIEEGNPAQLGDCGTTACALGWMPFIFPEDWCYSRHWTPMLKTSERPVLVFDDTVEFFLPSSDGEETWLHDLFYSTGYPNNADLNDPMIVVNRIREFVANYKG